MASSYVVFAAGMAGVACCVAVSSVGCSADPGDALKVEGGASPAVTGSSSGGITDDAAYADSTGGSSSGIGTSSGSPSSSSSTSSSSGSSSSGSSSGMEAAPPPPPPCTTCAIELRYSNNNTVGATKDIRAQFEIYNNGTGSQDLAALKVRYYFTADGSQSQSFSLDYADHQIAVQATFAAMTTPTATADHYMEMSLSGYTVGAGSNSGQIQPRFHDSSYQVTFNQDNDYSYNASAAMAFVDNMTMTVYQNGTLVWGTEPGGATASPDAGLDGGQDAATEAAGD